MFRRERFLVWTWDSLQGRADHIAVLTPDLSDAFDLAQRKFIENGYPDAGSQWLDHPMRPGIPGASVQGWSSRKEVDYFLRGLNKPWGTWDYRSVGVVSFTDGDVTRSLYVIHIMEIEKLIRRRDWLPF